MTDAAAQPLGDDASPTALALEDWFERPGWALAPSTPAPAAPSGPCLVLGGAAFGDALVAALRARGCAARGAAAAGEAPRTGGTPAIRPTSSEDHARLVDELERGASPPRRIVVAWALDAAAGPPLERALFSLLALARALAARHGRRQLALDIVTSGACAVAPGERCQPELATVAGPLRVIPLELPHVRTRHVDVALGAGGRDAARAVADELGRAQVPVVALRGERRFVPTLTPVRLGGGGARVWRERGSYLVTGGLGAIGLAIGEHLATHARARLTLLGRRGLPPPEHWDDVLRADPGASSRQARAIAAIRRMRDAGAEVSVHRADVADAAALRRARGELLEAHGTLDGILHVAGVASRGGHDGLLEARRRADVEEVLAPKIAGTRALLDVFGDLAPDFVVLFSSLATIIGGVGHADYCAANAFMDALADGDLGREGGQGPRVVSIDWGGWLRSGIWTPRPGDVGMAPGDAIEALRRVLAHHDGPRMVVAPVRVGAARPWADAAQDPAPSAGPADPGASGLDERLARMWADALGLERVATDGDFFGLGGTSVLGVELIWRVADELGCKLPMRALVDGRTPAAIARLIEDAKVGSIPR